MAKLLENMTSEELDTREQQLLAIIEKEEPEFRLGPAGLSIREQELEIRLQELGEEVEPNIPNLSPDENFLRDQGIQKILSLPEMAVADPTDVINNYEAFETNPRINKIGFREALVRAKKLELLPFVGSLY